MATEFHDNKICTFEILSSWRFPRKKKKNSIFGRFSSLRPQPPSKAKIIFYRRLAVSEKLSKRHAERVWANSLRKLFSAGFTGVGGFWVGFFPLRERCPKHLLRLFLVFKVRALRKGPPFHG